MEHVLPATPEYPWPHLDLDPEHLKELVALMAGCKYKLGAKAPSLDFQLASIKQIDCSGFVRLMIYKLTMLSDPFSKGLVIPDGSFNQGEWFEKNNFKPSDTESCKLLDGKLRLLWMTPKQGGGVGHIAFVLNGVTYESYGGHGPGSRKFTGKSNFQKIAKVFVLALPITTG